MIQINERRTRPKRKKERNRVPTLLRYTKVDSASSELALLCFRFDSKFLTGAPLEGGGLQEWWALNWSLRIGNASLEFRLTFLVQAQVIEQRFHLFCGGPLIHVDILDVVMNTCDDILGPEGEFLGVELAAVAELLHSLPIPVLDAWVLLFFPTYNGEWPVIPL